MSLLREQLQASLGSDYIVGHELGGGGMSRVFVAQECRLDRTVAIKVLTPAADANVSSERFEREIRVVARLQHPHIVPILTAGAAAGLPYYTMPFVDGESLRARLASIPHHRMPLPESVTILRDIATALEYAHVHGVVHRDVKPENVLLTGRTAVVADFGIAKALSTATTVAPGAVGSTLTQAGTSLGTPAYMAPEQAVGDTIDPRADIYAWGVIAYELLSGAHPFAARQTAQQLIAAHIAESPAPLQAMRPDLPPVLASLVMRCLSKDPDRRPQSAGEILRVFDDPALLDSAVNGTGRSARTRAHAAAWWTAKNVGAALVSVGVIGVVGAGWPRIARTLHLGSAPEAVSPAPAAAVAASDAAIRTVVVLPFVNTGGNPQDEYFSDGVTDELAHALSQLPSLRVAARTSAYAFKGKASSVQDVGKALNVTAVIDGTVRRAGDRLRVTAELTKVADGLVLWSGSYESHARDVFEVQDSVTKSMVMALAPTLSGDAATVASRSRGTTDAQAFDLYLKGRYFWNKRTADGLKQGAAYFDQAIARDSSYALAYSGLADSYAVLAAFGYLEPRTAYARAKPAVMRALQLDSTLAEAHTSLGFIHLYYDLDPTAGDREFERAIALDSRYATAHLFRAWYFLVATTPDAAAGEAIVARDLEPLSLIINTRVATMLRYAERYAEAEQQLRRTLELDTNFAVAHDEMARVLASRGDYEGAIASARRSAALGYVHAPGILGYSLAKAGQRGEAEQIVTALVARSRTEYVAPFDIALVYVGLGDASSATAWLGKAFTVRDHEALHLRVEPLLRPLRTDPRFQAIVATGATNAIPASR